MAKVERKCENCNLDRERFTECNVNGKEDGEDRTLELLRELIERLEDL